MTLDKKKPLLVISVPKDLTPQAFKNIIKVMDDMIAKGFMEQCGRDEKGNKVFRITERGKLFAEAARKKRSARP